MKRRRVAYLNLQAAREGQASHAHVHEIIKGLRELGWLVDLYEPRYSNQPQNPTLLQRAVEFARAQISLWRSGKPDIIYIRWHFASWPTALFAKLRKIPVVQEVNGPFGDLFIAWPWTQKFSKLFKWSMRTQLQWANVVIAVTPNLAEWAIAQGAKNVHVVPNGANVNLFHPDAKPDPLLRLPDSYVVFFGALAPWQGIDTMLAAVQESAWPEGVHLVIVGDGIERPKVEAAMRYSKRVQYLGSQPYSKIPGIVAKSLAGLLPKTDPQGRYAQTGLFPLKLFETLACGVPAIVTNYPGMADLVYKYKCGLVIPDQNPKALAEAVRFLYANPEMRKKMGERGRVLVEQQHSWERRVKDTAQIILRLLNGKSL